MDISNFSKEIQTIENILSAIDNGKNSLQSVVDFLNNPELSPQAKQIAIEAIGSKLPELVPVFDSVTQALAS
jgi:hypothetical protein